MEEANKIKYQKRGPKVKNKITCQFALAPEVVERLDEESIKLYESKASIVNRILRKYFNENDEIER